MRLRFVQGRPIRQVTCVFLQGVTEELGKQGKKALLLIWDNARWPLSKQVTTGRPKPQVESGF
jgi:hypothetical protein